MTDLEIYSKAMLRGDYDTCARIEDRHGMYGYPPELVTTGLAAIAEGKDGHKAIDAYINGEEQ